MEIQALIPSWASAPSITAFLSTTTEEIELKGRNFFIIGRSSSQSNITVDHFSVSRKHAIILFNSIEKEFYIIDLATGHGTFLNGEKIKTPNIPIKINRCSITFGSCENVYRINVIVEDKQEGEEDNKKKEIVVEEDSRSKRLREIQMAIDSLNKPVDYKTEKQIKESNRNNNDNGDDNNEDVEDDENNNNNLQETDDGDAEKAWKLPISHYGIIGGHVKETSALAIDRAGARFISGGVDYNIRMYDFGGMTTAHRPIRCVTPFDGHPVTGISYSPSGSQFVVSTTSAKFNIYDREATFQLGTVKGDQYILDVTHTKGHIAAVNNVQWHPTDNNTILSCGGDSSIRIWDINGKTSFEMLCCTTVIRAKDSRGIARISVADACYNPDGKAIAAVTVDGALHIWQNKRSYGRPDLYVKDAHGSEISSCLFSPNGNFIGTRGFDDTLKLWDIRKIKEPLKIFTNLPNRLSETGLCFSPDSSIIVTGTNVHKENKNGKVSFFDTVSGDTTPIKEIRLTPGVGATCILWHKEINQIFLGLSNGGTQILYSPLYSQKGYLTTAGRAAKKREDGYAAISEESNIQTPHALKLFSEEVMTKKRKRDVLRSDPIASKAPEQPIRGPGQQGKSGDKSTFTTHLMKSMARDDSRFVDPREALLSYDTKNDEFVEIAYRNNKKILAATTLEEEEAKHAENRTTAAFKSKLYSTTEIVANEKPEILGPALPIFSDVGERRNEDSEETISKMNEIDEDALASFSDFPDMIETREAIRSFSEKMGENELDKEFFNWSKGLKPLLKKYTSSRLKKATLKAFTMKEISAYFTDLSLKGLEINGIDTDFCIFNKLTNLDLSLNQIEEIDNLPESLTVLQLVGNKISAIKNTDIYPSLIHLGLGYNNLSDEHFSKIPQLFPNLVSLDVSFNALCDLKIVMLTLKKMKLLTHLQISGNPFFYSHKNVRRYLLSNLVNIVQLNDLIVSEKERGGLDNSGKDFPPKLGLKIMFGKCTNVISSINIRDNNSGVSKEEESKNDAKNKKAPPEKVKVADKDKGKKGSIVETVPIIVEDKSLPTYWLIYDVINSVNGKCEEKTLSGSDVDFTQSVSIPIECNATTRDVLFLYGINISLIEKTPPTSSDTSVQAKIVNLGTTNISLRSLCIGDLEIKDTVVIKMMPKAGVTRLTDACLNFTASMSELN